MAKNSDTFNDRQKHSLEAKQKLLERAKAIAATKAEGFDARQEQLAATAEARDERRKVAEARKQAALAEAAANKAELKHLAEEAAEAERVAAEIEKNKHIAAAIELRAQQKAGRDAKYAARQARRESRRA